MTYYFRCLTQVFFLIALLSAWPVAAQRSFDTDILADTFGFSGFHGSPFIPILTWSNNNMNSRTRCLFLFCSLITCAFYASATNTGGRSGKIWRIPVGATGARLYR